MTKLISSAAFVAILLQPTGNHDRDRFVAKYKTIEAYEIRPGVLMMPRYSADGRVCAIGLEKLHYSPELVALSSNLLPEEVDEIFNELAPNDQRGPQPKDILERMGGGGITGTTGVTDEEYQNVSIHIFSTSGDDGSSGGEVVATLEWKNRRCQ